MGNSLKDCFDIVNGKIWEDLKVLYNDNIFSVTYGKRIENSFKYKKTKKCFNDHSNYCLGIRWVEGKGYPPNNQFFSLPTTFSYSSIIMLEELKIKLLERNLDEENVFLENIEKTINAIEKEIAKK